MVYRLALLIAMCISNFSIAQECNSILLGEIVDFHDNTPLSGAYISITGKTLATNANDEGKFRFKDLCDGVLELEVSHPDCKTQFITITLSGDSYEKIRLEHHVEELEGVNVTGKHQHTTTSAQEQRLAISEIEKFSGQSLGDALKTITGVSTLNTGATIVKPIIQGLNGSRILILNNNVRMQDMEWGEEHAPNVDINSNQNISVVKGAAALEYGGDAIGGVIIMNPVPLIRTDSLFGKTQLNLFSNGRGGNVTTGLTRTYDSGLYIKGQASYKKFGDMEAPDYVLNNTGINELGISFSIGKNDFKQGWEAYYSLFDTEIGILRSSHIGNVDDLIQSINSSKPNTIGDFSYNINQPNQEVTHHLGKLSFYRRFEGLGKWTTQYDFQSNRRFEYDIRVGSDANKASLDLKLSTHSITSSFKLDANENLELNVGVLGRYQTNFANPNTGVRRLIPDYDKYDFGIFSIATFNVSDAFSVDGGLRYDFTHMDAQKFYRTSRWEERGYDVEFGNIVIEDLGTQLLTNPTADYHNISATAGFKYDLSADNLIRFNYALAQRAPNPSELFSDGLHHSAARIELGDIRITSESSSKLSLSFEKASDAWGYTIAPYFNAIKDFIILEPTGVELTIRGAFPVWEYRQTNARLLGVDMSIYKQWSTQIKTNHKFSWVHGADISNDTPLINIPAANLSNIISYENPRWKNLIVSLESQYVFEQQRYPDNIVVFSPQQAQDVELTINTPPAAYHLLAFDAETSFSITNTNDFKIGVRATNLLNTSYRDYLNRQRYFVDDLGRNVSVRLIYNY